MDDTDTIAAAIIMVLVLGANLIRGKLYRRIKGPPE
jgi:hypothetical protein